MKITVDIDCTPQEMRSFFGLPDLEPMQQAVMEELQRRLLSSMDHLSPTTVMKDWFGPMNSAWSQVLFNPFNANASASRRGGGSPSAAGPEGATPPGPGEESERDHGAA